MNFLRELIELDLNNISNEIIKEIIKIFKKYWNFEKRDFYIKSVNNILVTNFIFDLLLFNSFNSISDSDEKKIYFMIGVVFIPIILTSNNIFVFINNI